MVSFRIVSFDFDHTLTANVSAFEHIANFLGVTERAQEIESAFKAGEIDTYAFSDLTAGLLAGVSQKTVSKYMLQIPLLEGVPEMMAYLRNQGIRIIINSVGYRNLLIPWKNEFGLCDVSGAELETDQSCFTGKINKYFPLEDKITFAEQFAKSHGYALENVIAVGDGLSDVPLFRSVGASIAFNSDEKTKLFATYFAEGRNVSSLVKTINQIID
jgi:phosphoserine phosphatase